MYGGCDTCKLLGEENCKGCLWDAESQRNTHWEPKEPFINKPCISEGICHEDKVKILNKIKSEIEKKSYIHLFEIEEDFDLRRIINTDTVLEIIDKYMKESEGKE